MKGFLRNERMQGILEDLQQMNNEFRNLCAPFDQRMTAVDERITRILERLERVESKLNISPETERPAAAAQSSIERPEAAPPQVPGPEPVSSDRALMELRRWIGRR